MWTFLSVLASAEAFSASGSIHTLLLCRHGDSVWNGGQQGCEECFTGWTDVPLSQAGENEARVAASQLANYFYDIDVVYTSMLQRAQASTEVCLAKLREQKIPPVVSDYRLAERHYGALQGYIKREVEDGKYGHDREDVEKWRRSWSVVPPLLSDDDERRRKEIDQYSSICGGAHNVPRGESLEMVAKNRIRPLLNEVITPMLDMTAKIKSEKSKKRVHEEVSTGLVVAHANSLRALIGVICEVEDDPVALEILESLKIPTGVPLVIHYQQLPDGRFRACPLPEPDECLIEDMDTDGYIKAKEAPPNLGHNSLPVWPLDHCIPLEKKARQDFFAAFENGYHTLSMSTSSDD